MPNVGIRLVGIVISAVIVVALTFMLLAALSREDSPSREAVATSAALGTSPIEDSFAVFKRPREQTDSLPQDLDSWPGPVVSQLRTDESRLVFETSDARFYAVPQGDTGICLVSWGTSPGLSCAELESASRPTTSLFVTGGAGVYGLVPDEVAGGTVSDARGTRELDKGANALVDTSVDRPERVSLSLRDGSEATIDVNPGEPGDMTDTPADP